MSPPVTELKPGNFYRHPAFEPGKIGGAYRYRRTATNAGLMESADGSLSDWHLKVHPENANGADIFLWVLVHEPQG